MDDEQVRSLTVLVLDEGSALANEFGVVGHAEPPISGANSAVARAATGAIALMAAYAFGRDDDGVIVVIGRLAGGAAATG